MWRWCPQFLSYLLQLAPPVTLQRAGSRQDISTPAHRAPLLLAAAGDGRIFIPGRPGSSPGLSSAGSLLFAHQRAPTTPTVTARAAAAALTVIYPLQCTSAFPAKEPHCRWDTPEPQACSPLPTCLGQPGLTRGHRVCAVPRSTCTLGPLPGECLWPPRSDRFHSHQAGPPAPRLLGVLAQGFLILKPGQGNVPGGEAESPARQGDHALTGLAACQHSLPGALGKEGQSSETRGQALLLIARRDKSAATPHLPGSAEAAVTPHLF